MLSSVHTAGVDSVAIAVTITYAVVRVRTRPHTQLCSTFSVL